MNYRKVPIAGFIETLLGLLRRQAPPQPAPIAIRIKYSPVKTTRPFFLD